MRNKIISSLFGAVFILSASGVAFAADMAVKALPPAAAPISWTGWYGGLNVGGTWSDDPVNVSSNNVQLCSVSCGGEFETATAAAQGATGAFPGKMNGIIGGLQLGYNWQWTASWVAGLEADIQGIGSPKANGSSSAAITIGGFTTTTNVSTTKETDWLGTVRGRLGWLANPSLLVYGTGGLAYGEVKANTNISVAMPADFGNVVLNPGSSSGISQTRAGWTAGGGVEWMLSRQWSVKAEYLYYDLGKVTYNGVLADAIISVGPGQPANFFTNSVQTSTRFDGSIVRVGLNYQFH